MASWRPKGSSPGTPAKREGSKIYPWSKRRMDSVDESEIQSPSTADIVAAQSQDYVDERELEFRQTIQHLAEFFWKMLQKKNVGYQNSDSRERFAHEESIFWFLLSKYGDNDRTDSGRQYASRVAFKFWLPQRPMCKIMVVVAS
ncbi:uncharacterized protein NPIL_621981 [Nephila pilipes]|uniref:Uncharacterized protein n=1 Tax=Nephila pilipes TaxID=299642 RepID=A0A8X6R5H2_NEPPI|nr:uncharacterized protein NPIL_621981 [Nephila pilipes]